MKSQVRMYKKIDSNERKRLAEQMTMIVDSNSRYDVPYMSNKGDDIFWIADNCNVWKIKFFHEDPFRFEVIFRYKNQLAIEALASWFAYRIGGKVIEAIEEVIR